MFRRRAREGIKGASDMSNRSNEKRTAQNSRTAGKTGTEHTGPGDDKGGARPTPPCPVLSLLPLPRQGTVKRPAPGAPRTPITRQHSDLYFFHKGAKP